MKEINLRRVDLNLLTVFEAVYEETSQVKAAERLCMTPSAISHALTRLRFLTGDRLFVASSRGLTATRDADALFARVHAALDLIRAEFVQRARFDPTTSERSFVVAFGYGGGAVYGLPLFERLRRSAPGVRLVIRSIDPVQEIPGLLREHRLDLALDVHRFDDAMLEQEPASRDTLVVLARTGHPRIRGATTLAQLANEHFVNVFESTFDADNPSLRKLVAQVAPRAVLEVPNALLMPRVVATTDLLSVTTERMARLFVGDGSLTCHPLATDIAPIESQLIWHRSMATDAAHAWLREQMRAVLDEGGATRSDRFRAGLTPRAAR